MKTETKAPAICYPYQNRLYINATSRCPSACSFCIKFSWDYQFRGHDLQLSGDPTVDQVIAALPADLSAFHEVIYCGYGESTYRLADMPAMSAAFRARGAKRIRLNTIGLGNAIHKRDIAADLKPVVDAVSISMNTMDPVKYVELVRPIPEIRATAFESAKAFARSCAKMIPDTTLTSVDRPDFDPTGVERFAAEIGAKFRLRPYLDDYEEE